MTPQAKREYMKAVYPRYKGCTRKEKKNILDEFTKNYHCHRKHAIRLLCGAPPSDTPAKRGGRKSIYSPTTISILEAVWKASDFLWSSRLKAAIPLWMPWIKKHFNISPDTEHQLLKISPPQIDRRLKSKKHLLRKQIYGTTKPGTLLKHHIPIKTDSWNIRRPGFTEIDLVSHSGNSASGDFAHTLNQSDIKTTWVERRAVLGKGQEGVTSALDEMRQALPFDLLGIDSDNGSEFINEHLWRYCQTKPKIQFTRGRPYKKNDNAHVEQKNWTHVRKLLGYLRYDTQQAVDIINDLYKNELRYFQNFFQPSVKLKKKVRIGSRLTRRYDEPKTPLERVEASPCADQHKLACLKALRDKLDPFILSQTITRKLEAIHELAYHKKDLPKPIPLRKSQRLFYAGISTLDSDITSPISPEGPVADSLRNLRYSPIAKLKAMVNREIALEIR
jgi:hypothetical protein